MRKILVADLFCGAGGSSTGARQAIEQLGRTMDLVCVNHWDRAIETHKRMHPEARHYCQDVASARPIECVPEGRLDLLMASPTCTYHSRARGGRPTSDQQRMDPWHVVTWLTELRVERLLIENVPEFVDWGPVDARTGRPLKSKKGQYFREWIATLERLGYAVDWKFLNCADYGDATTRRRFFLLGRKRGRIRWPAPSHTREPAHDLLAPLQKWRPARECIDWSLRGNSIYGRKFPLSVKTLLRVYAGVTRFGWPSRYEVRLRRELLSRGVEPPAIKAVGNGRNPEPFIDVLRNNNRARGLDEPVATVNAQGEHHALVEPFLLGQHFERRPRSTDEPLRTATGIARQALIEPFIMAQGEGGMARELREPMPAIPTGGAHALIAPYYGSGSGKTCKSVDEPLDTVTVQDRFGLIVPITHANGMNRVRDITDPLPTLTTAKRGELAFITASYGERDGQLPRIHDLELPPPTIAASGSVRMAEADESDDISYRMLHWRELARAMSFSDADSDYEFAGTKTEITKQIGNAVPVRTARALVGAALWDVAQ
ncbi:MAG TPA: DNA cytosine methyltransferase [Reyranella sp.]|nr:DNA cytosine methyltransferase [Reyranella sp.]